MSKWINFALAFGFLNGQSRLDPYLFELLLEERRLARTQAATKPQVEACNDESLPAEDESSRKAA